MQELPLVSVIIPVYNAEKTLALCLQAILNSDYPNFEVIAIDDGSKDSSLEIIKSFPEISYYSQSNQGSATTKNRGAKYARGTFFYFLDSDVVVSSNTVSKFIDTALKYEVDLVCGRYSTEPLNDGLVHHYKALTDYVLYCPPSCRSEVKINYQIGGGGDLYSKKSFENLKGFDESYLGASVEREELMLRFYEAEYSSAANPQIKTKHYFPDFKSMIKAYIFRIYETVKLIDGKVTPFTYISIEKAILAPFFAFAFFISIILCLLYDFSVFSVFACGTMFLVFSRDLIFESIRRKGFKTPLILGIHLVTCNVIFLSGSISKILVKFNKAKAIWADLLR